MPRKLTQFRVFIASPGGLDAERKAFRDKLTEFTRLHSEDRDVIFKPIGWEDTLGGAIRPQSAINRDLEQCDCAVFMLCDRWCSPTGPDYSSGVEEEWKIAERLYETNKSFKIFLFFKEFSAKTVRHDNDQLNRVLAFRHEIESRKRHFFKDFKKPKEFCERLERHLSDWLLEHERAASGTAASSLAVDPPSTAPTMPQPEPGFAFWYSLADGLIAATPPNYADALFCARQAEKPATSDVDWAKARNLVGRCQFHLNNITEAFDIWSEIAHRFEKSVAIELRERMATALVNKGIALGSLGRSEEEIAVYDEAIARFGAAPEAALREQVAKALVNKGVRVGSLGRSEEAIAVYDEVVARFGSAPEAALRENVAMALFNKGFVLGSLGRSEEAIAVYDEAIARFVSAPEAALRENVARALFSKGVTLGSLGRSAEAIAAYDEVIARFGSAPEAALREQVANALVNKGFRLGSLGRSEEAIAVYDEAIARFGSAPEVALREQVAKALFNKGFRLGSLGRSEEEIAVYDEVIARFGSDKEPGIVEAVDGAKANKKWLATRK